MERKETETLPRGSQWTDEKEAERQKTMNKTIHHTELTKTESETQKQVIDKGEEKEQ